MENPVFIVGLQSEAKILRQYGYHQIGISGGDLLIAQKTTEFFIQKQAKGIISFGFAGGLDPSIPVGGIIIPTAIRTIDNLLFEVHRNWRKKIIHLMAGIRIYSGTMLGSDNPIIEKKIKADIYHKFGTIAVDMESHVVASICNKNDVPFCAIRVVIDTANTSLSKQTADIMQKDGSISVSRAIKTILNYPRALKELMILGKQYHHAYRQLNNVARLGFPNFGFGF
ncbi:MAG: hypothetical protein JNK86_05685 [Alphaproteobacteria bacterium]|nr:hypothetical protein [Alphaproteobacteria bacterium]